MNKKRYLTPDESSICEQVVITLLLYNGQDSADEIRWTEMTQSSVRLPIGTGLGIEDHDYPALRAPNVDRPPGLPGRTVQSVLRYERHNRATVTWSVDGPPIIVQGGPNASIYRN
jgi:hypothetical protein